MSAKQPAPQEPDLRLLDTQYYAHHILSFGGWIARLRVYNAKYWDNYFTEEDFEAAEAQVVNMPPEHVQSIFDIYGFHVQFGSLLETFEMWCKVFVGELGAEGLWRSTWVRSLEGHLELHEQARSYGRGIHLVNCNLAAHRTDARNRHTNDLGQIYRENRSAEEVVAQLEPMSFYGVLLGLFKMQRQDGLPNSILAGVLLSSIGSVESSLKTMFIRWDAEKHKAFFGWWDESDVIRPGQAVPVILER